jgi:nitrous oxidase accessory protein
VRTPLLYMASLLLIIFNSQSTLARTVKVGKANTIKSIAKGIKTCSDGDTLLIGSGEYREHSLLIDKPITIIGSGKVTVNGLKKGYIFTVRADHVTIENLSLKNVGSSFTKDYAAIHLYKSRHFKIINNRLSKVFFGILVEKSHEGIISNNVITSDATVEYNSGNGVHLWYSTKINITDNILNQLRDGIYLEFVNDCKISGNSSFNNIRYGMHFMFSDDNTYTSNIFSNNGAGVAVMFSKNITMSNNVFSDNWGTASYGLLLKEIYDSDITSNTFSKNTVGIYAEGATRVNFKRNTLSRNGWAVKLSGSSYENKFHRNNFLHNSFDLSYKSRQNSNVFDYNYWSSYSGYDLDKDGVGDVPYRPVKLFSYVVNKTPEAIILLRSLFVDLINFSEKVSPVFTPDNLLDNSPLMKKAK